MAIIKSGDSEALLKIESGSNAARVTLVGPSGGPLLGVSGNAVTNLHALPTGGYNDNMFVANRVDRTGGNAVTLHQPIFSESFEGSIINPVRWTITSTTMAATQSSVGGLVLNSGNITTVNTGYLLKSALGLKISMRNLMQIKIRARINVPSNSVSRIGLADSSTYNGSPSTGIYFETSSGSTRPVLAFNNTYITGSSFNIDPTKFYVFDIVKDDDSAAFFVHDTSTDEIQQQVLSIPVAGSRLLSSTQIPLQIQLFNSAVSPAAAPVVIVSDVYVSGLDAVYNLSAQHIHSLHSRNATQHPFSGVQSAQFANSAAPANATLSNTAAGYTTLGGLFQFAAVAGALTDYALFVYQVPVGSNLVVTGIDIDTWNTGAAVATTPTLMVWGLHANNTAVSLATAAGSKIPLGTQILPIGTVIGGTANRLSKYYDTPIVVNSGKYLAISLRMPVGTATASQVIAGMVNIDGYFV